MDDFDVWKNKFTNIIDEEHVACPICHVACRNLTQHMLKHKDAEEVKERQNISWFNWRQLYLATRSNSRDSAAQKYKDMATQKAMTKWSIVKPTCAHCNNIISFDLWRKNPDRQYCQSAQCVSEYHRKSSVIQDKTRISEYVLKSKKWKENTRSSVDARRSNIEKQIVSFLSAATQCKIETSVPYEYAGGCAFMDIYIPQLSVFVEVDGVFHFDENDQYCNKDYVLDQHIIANGDTLIRIKVVGPFRPLATMTELLNIIHGKKRGVFKI